MSGLKEVIEKQNSKIKTLQNDNCSLKKKNKILADKCTQLLEHIEK